MLEGLCYDNHMRLPFGKPITAREIEEFATREDEVAFVRLANAMLASTMADVIPGTTMPACSERVNVPDGGVDAEVTLEAGIAVPEMHGLLGPGRSVYQFKWRDLAARKRTEILREVSRSAAGDVAKLKVRGKELPDRYVLLTNLHLTAPQTRQLRKAILTGCPEFSDKPIVIWGAGEISAYLNTHPRIRHAFFSEGVFCTIGIAVQELKNQYRAFPWVEIKGRDPQTEAIREFATGGSEGVLLVCGPPYVGKTRTVQEALTPLGGRVVWASHAEVLAEEHLRDLDHETTTILVLDNCEGETLERSLRWATSRSHLKTILIGRQGANWPGVSTLAIGPLEDLDVRKLLVTIAPNLPLLQETRLNRLTGGLPGLAVYAAGEVSAGKDLSGEETDASNVGRKLGRLIKERVLAVATSEERRALQVVSLLTQIGIKDSAFHELDVVCRGLGYDASEVRSVLPALAEKRIVLERGRFVEVVPPLLGEALAAEAITGRPLALPSLLVSLDGGARLRLLSRLRNIGGSDEVDRALESIFSPNGWFPDLESLLLRAEEFRSLAPGHPVGASACLHRLLSGLPAFRLREKVAGKARREIVWALSDLSLGRETFQKSAEVLLCLAEAENESFGNNASGEFSEVFHPFHPEVACPLSERLQFLEWAANSQSPDRRRLVAAAAGHAASTEGHFGLHHPEGPRMPETPAWARTRGELRSYFRGLLAILEGLSRDTDETVRTEARASIISRCRGFVRLGVSEQEEAGLVDKTFALLKEFAAQATGAKVLADIRSQLEMLLQYAESQMEKAPQESELTDLLRAVKQRTLGFLGELTGDSFAASVKRWAGPHSWQDRIAEFSAPEGKTRPSQAALKKLADEATQDPSLLDNNLLDWLLGPEAQYALCFLIRLGERDTPGIWREPLIQRLGLPRGPDGFGWYACGWAQRDRRSAEEFLDRLLGTKPEAGEGVLAATLRIAANSSGANRVLRLADNKRLPREILVQQLAGWTNALTSQDFVRLFRGLDDGSWETGLALLDMLAYRQWKTGDLSEEIRIVAWRLLERTASTKTDHQAYNWDHLAAHLTETDPAAMLDLIEKLAKQDPSPHGRAVFNFLEEFASTWKVLARLNRPALVQRLLRISVASENVPFWIHWCSRHLIDPSQDGRTLLEFAKKNGEIGALAVVDLLDSSKAGFWDLIREIVVTFGDSERAIGRVETCIYHAEWSGSLAPVFEEKRKQVARLAQDPDPRVSRWASGFARELEGDVKREERRDQEDFLWDYDVKRPELMQMLRNKQSPDRLWAIQRILLHAPREEAIRLLTVSEIQEALPHVELPDRVRKIWEAYVAHWSQGG